MSGAVVLAGLLLTAGPASPPIASLADLGTALSACVRGDAPAAGLALDIRFTLSRRGTLMGTPVVVTRPTSPLAGLRSVKSAVLDALRRCTPFRFAPDFAQAVAGHPLTLRVLTGGRAILT